MYYCFSTQPFFWSPVLHLLQGCVAIAQGQATSPRSLCAHLDRGGRGLYHSPSDIKANWNLLWFLFTKGLEGEKYNVKKYVCNVEI